jgi:TMEM199 family protein
MIFIESSESELTYWLQTSAYKALMTRLRREEEERSYERMTNPPPPMETFAQRFPASSAAHAFSSSYQNINTSDPDDDGLTFADVDRQMALILNVLLSIVACAGAIWVAARWWNTPARLALSMSGSILVGVAEVVVYSGYIRRVGEAKGKEKVVKEVKEIVNTWVVGAGDEASGVDDTESASIEPTHIPDDVKTRRRKRDTS